MEKLQEFNKLSQAQNFQVKVSILECRQLKLEASEDVPNPYVIVKVRITYNLNYKTLNRNFIITLK